MGRRYLRLVDRCLGRFRLYTDVALFFFSIIGEREVLFLFLSRALGGLLREKRGSVNRLCSFTIYMSKPVCSLFEQMVSKLQG